MSQVTSNFVDVRTPAFSNLGIVSGIIESSSGLRSQAINYEYGGKCDPLQFNTREMLTNAFQAVDLDETTCITTYSDGKLYLGTRNGYVKVVEYDPTSLFVTKTCQPEQLRDPRFKRANGDLSSRTILGITFHPKDRKGRPYVTTSTLCWLKQKRVDPDNPYDWAN